MIVNGDYLRHGTLNHRRCTKSQTVPFQCSVPVILLFLQALLNKGNYFSTIKVYLADISACHVGFGSTTARQTPPCRLFYEGVRLLRPVSKQLAPSWPLPVVLDTLCQKPFEPLDQVDLKMLSFKTALLLAMASAKCVSGIHSLSLHSSCAQLGYHCGLTLPLSLRLLSHL